MTINYNVPVKVLDPENESIIEKSLRGYDVFVDRSGNLDGTDFIRQTVPYVGEIIVVRTIKEKAARTAYKVLSGIEGLVVLPVTECTPEEAEEWRAIARAEKAAASTEDR